MCIHNIMYNIRTHYVHTYTHTQTHLISAGGPMQMPRTKAQYVYIFIYVCVCVRRVSVCAQVVQRVRAFYLGCIITKTVGTSVTAVAEQHAAAAHQSFGID